MNHLARLPAEILQEICDLVQASDQPVSLVVSKSLLPFLHRARYRYVRVVASKANRLEHLARLVKAHPDVFASTLSFFCDDGRGVCDHAVEHLSLILSSMPNVRSLALTLRTPGPLRHLLVHLPHPEKLMSLSWIQTIHVGTKTLSSLSNFPNLVSLAIGGSACLLDNDALDSLLRLPLVTLSFERGSRLSPTWIARLITGPTRHTTLRRLVFDHLEAKRGTPARNVRLTRPSDLEPARRKMSEWHLPFWNRSLPPGSHRHDLDRILFVARGEGLDVLGTAIEALAIEDAYDRERAILESRIDELRARCGSPIGVERVE